MSVLAKRLEATKTANTRPAKTLFLTLTLMQGAETGLFINARGPARPYKTLHPERPKVDTVDT